MVAASASVLNQYFPIFGFTACQNLFSFLLFTKREGKRRVGRRSNASIRKACGDCHCHSKSRMRRMEVVGTSTVSLKLRCPVIRPIMGFFLCLTLYVLVFSITVTLQNNPSIIISFSSSSSNKRLGYSLSATTPTHPDGVVKLGFFVLGMHRSGTSMLTGSLVTAFGYVVGGPLVPTRRFNKKGYYERMDVVAQNDVFLKRQGLTTRRHITRYSHEQTLNDLEDGTIAFDNGKVVLEFLNDVHNAPWVLKDPRMVVTLKTWLKLMVHKPAIIFTYRHPIKVAMSLKERDRYPFKKGLRLWIVYNMLAVRNSRGLCVVRTSNEAILADPLTELQRISDSLTSDCGVVAPARRMIGASVDQFIDQNLQPEERKVPRRVKKKATAYNASNCTAVLANKSLVVGRKHARQGEQSIYQKAMKVYCDLQSGKAFEEGYVWPALQI